MARFDKEAFADLLHKARGDRSINQYGLHAGVDPGYISRLVRAIPDTAPGPGIIRRLAAKAYGGVKFEDLMIAAGHIDAPVGTRPKETPLDQRVENDDELSLEGGFHALAHVHPGVVGGTRRGGHDYILRIN